MRTPYIVDSDEPCSVCGGSAIVGLCGRTDDGSDGPCVLRPGDHVCHGEGDVAGDWAPATSCRNCCVCPCGSRSDGTMCPFCEVQMHPGIEPPAFDPSTHRPRAGGQDQ